jgi:sec-independent protein translocase protein TatB
MPSLQDSALIFILALLLFGPKKLPVLARELGKWIAEFRRASNEFKMQMEDELRMSEQAERQQKIAAMEAAAPVAPPLEDVPVEILEHPHLDTHEAVETQTDAVEPASEPLPIATSGELNIMPPSTGLPVPQTSGQASSDLGPLIESIPVVETPHHDHEAAENATHG